MLRRRRRPPSLTSPPDRPPVPLVTPRPTPDPTPLVGGVDGAAGGPLLTIVPIDDDTIQATIEDPDAKAWRLTISGTGAQGGDRWEIKVETGDVEPIVTATEFRDGTKVDVLDLTGFVDGTAAAGGCHGTLPVCLDSGGFSLPDGGDGTFSVRLDLPQGQVPLVIRGATAAWDGEPFILGPWHETDPFPWGEG